MSSDNPTLDKTPYELLGGEEKVKELVDRFYDHMDSLAETRSIRNMHAKSLKGSREKLFLFLSGWLGGPDLYLQKYGHPMLRRRHLPFSIGQAEAEQWLLCMEKAMDDMSINGELRHFLSRSFHQTALHMRNKLDTSS